MSYITSLKRLIWQNSSVLRNVQFNIIKTLILILTLLVKYCLIPTETLILRELALLGVKDINFLPHVEAYSEAVRKAALCLKLLKDNPDINEAEHYYLTK